MSKYLTKTMAKDGRIEGVLVDIGKASVYGNEANKGAALGTLMDLAWGRDAAGKPLYTTDEAVELGRELYARGAKVLTYRDARYVRAATADELERSIDQSSRDGGAGVIEIDGRPCYVQF